MGTNQNREGLNEHFPQSDEKSITSIDTKTGVDVTLYTEESKILGEDSFNIGSCKKLQIELDINSKKEALKCIKETSDIFEDEEPDKENNDLQRDTIANESDKEENIKKDVRSADDIMKKEVKIEPVE